MARVSKGKSDVFNMRVLRADKEEWKFFIYTKPLTDSTSSALMALVKKRNVEFRAGTDPGYIKFLYSMREGSTMAGEAKVDGGAGNKRHIKAKPKLKGVSRAK